MLPKTIGLRNDLRTVPGSPSALFIFYFSIRSLDNDMPLLCLTMSARAELKCWRRLGSFLSKPFIFFATLSDILYEKTDKMYNHNAIGERIFNKIRQTDNRFACCYGKTGDLPC